MGELKVEVREAILEGTIKNTLEDALPFLIDRAERKGLKKK